MRKKMLLLFLALLAMVAAFGSAPQPADAADCFWYCSNGSVHCSCGSFRLCPWPPPPIACD